MFPNVANLAPFLPSYLSAELPSTQWTLKKKAGLETKQVNTHAVCFKTTHSYIFMDTATSHCPHCGAHRDRSSDNSVMIPDVCEYIKALMSKKKYARAMSYPLSRDKGDGDMWDQAPLNEKTPEQIQTTIYLRLSMDSTVVLKTKEVLLYIIRSFKQRPIVDISLSKNLFFLTI